ncbi:MAG: XrtA-associated tyrosine autokinase [Proteobacteria bacterium]|nr:XrtA-associated tyrosine autokinase [Pseudomonadota bacterium]
MSIIEKALDKRDGIGDKGKKRSPTSIGSETHRSETHRSETHHPEKVTKSENTRTDKSISPKVSKSINLDLDSLGKRGYLTPSTDNKILFEQYRRVKLPIIRNAFENNEAEKSMNIVMVTSSLSGEGKSFTSLNLAMSIAYEYNHTVLLIDSDVTKKMSSKVMGVEGSWGLIEYLAGKEQHLENLILKTNIPKLNLIPSGSYSELATELFSSRKMTDLIEELSSRYNDRLIIIDTPPVLEDSSAKVLSHLAHQIVYIVEAEKTPRHMVEQGLRMLGREKSIGIVLNKSNVRHNPSYYYV